MKKIQQIADSTIITFGMRVASVCLLALLAYGVAELGGILKDSVVRSFVNSRDIEKVTITVERHEGEIRCLEKVVRKKHPDIKLYEGNYGKKSIL